MIACNLPYDAFEEDVLESLFPALGKVVGYVAYKIEEGALAVVQKAVKPFGLAVFKCPVFVDYDKGTRRRASSTGRASCGARRTTIIRGAGGLGEGADLVVEAGGWASEGEALDER